MAQSCCYWASLVHGNSRHSAGPRPLADARYTSTHLLFACGPELAAGVGIKTLQTHPQPPMQPPGWDVPESFTVPSRESGSASFPSHRVRERREREGGRPANSNSNPRGPAATRFGLLLLHVPAKRHKMVRPLAVSPGLFPDPSISVRVCTDSSVMPDHRFMQLPRSRLSGHHRQMQPAPRPHDA